MSMYMYKRSKRQALIHAYYWCHRLMYGDEFSTITETIMPCDLVDMFHLYYDWEDISWIKRWTKIQ